MAQTAGLRRAYGKYGKRPTAKQSITIELTVYAMITIKIVCDICDFPLKNPPKAISLFLL
jgi:hypothetical protein